MSLEKDMSHIEAQDRLINSLRLKIEKLEGWLKYRDEQIESLREDYDYEKNRADLLQQDINAMDDFTIALNDANKRKMN